MGNYVFKNNVLNELVLDTTGYENINELCVNAFEQAYLAAIEQRKNMINVGDDYYTKDIWFSREFTELLEFLDGNGFVIHYRPTGTLVEVDIVSVLKIMLRFSRDGVPFRRPNI